LTLTSRTDWIRSTYTYQSLLAAGCAAAMAARPALVAGPIRFAKGCSCTAVRSPRPANAVCTWLGVVLGLGLRLVGVGVGVVVGVGVGLLGLGLGLGLGAHLLVVGLCGHAVKPRGDARVGRKVH